MAGKTLINGTAYEISGGKTLIGGTGYGIKGGRTLIGGTGYDISFELKPEANTLDGCSWKNISEISRAGLASLYWKVGDRKKIILNGTVGSLNLSNYETYAFIIGIDHNPTREGGIHFQLAKTALSGGKDICLCDSSYGSSGSSAAFRMNISYTNAGGWEDSYMRNNICGTSTTNCAGTIIGAFPAELRNVLRRVIKWTNNDGPDGTWYAISGTDEYCFLLSEYEVFGGDNAYGNKYEKDFQQQYAYYSSGSKIKYKDNATTIAGMWWLRTPRVYTDDEFAAVETNGVKSRGFAHASIGFAPGFCV